MATDFLDSFIKSLLHLDDVRTNKLLDVGDVTGKSASAKAYKLISPTGENSRTMLQVIRSRRGKPSNKTILRDSALVRSAIDNPLVEKWDWADFGGGHDPAALDKFISDVYNSLDLKGNNPLFLGVGNLSWVLPVGDEIKPVNSPLLIFPIRFVRGSSTSPVEVEFVDDDAFFNPCLYARMHDDFSPELADNFPHPNGIGASFDDPIDLEILRDGCEYFEKVEKYVATLKPADTSITFSFDRNMLVIAQYNHSDICMYYDVRRNKQKIYAHPLVQRVFGCGAELPAPAEANAPIRPVLSVDSVQESLISRIAAGESLIIKGPPGTGKTLTIANILSTLLAGGKSILVASEKLSALAEVYAKMPDRLRKFIMLLDYETEQKAAAVNPSEIRAEFKRLIKTRSEYVYDTSYDIRQDRAERAKNDAVRTLSDYMATVFGDDVMWGSYYDALDLYYSHEELPTIDFIPCEAVEKLSRDDYNTMLLLVRQAAADYKAMAPNNAVTDCPWLGVTAGVNTEGALNALGSISKLFTDLDNSLLPAKSALAIDWDKIKLGDIYEAAKPNTMSPVDIKKALTTLSKDDGKALIELMIKYDGAKAQNADGFEFPDGIGEKCFFDLLAKSKLPEFDLSRLTLVAKNKSVFIPESGKELNPKLAQKFVDSMLKIGELHDKVQELEADVLFVLDKAPTEDDGTLYKACEALQGYAEGGRDSVGLFDFKAKNAEKLLRKYCSDEGITLVKLAETAKKYIEISKCNHEMNTLATIIAHLIGKEELTQEEFHTLFVVGEATKGKEVTVQSFVTDCVEVAKLVESCREHMTCPDNFTLAELYGAVAFRTVKAELNSLVLSLCTRAEVTVEKDVYAQAKSLATLIALFESDTFGGNADAVAQFVTELQTCGGQLVKKVDGIVDALVAFAKDYFENKYTDAPMAVTLGMSKVLISQSRDRSVMGAALSYDEVLKSQILLPFFSPIEDGSIKLAPDDFENTFIHSFVSLAIANKLRIIGDKRNTIGRDAKFAFDAFRDSENELFECNAAKTENLCMKRINPNDDDFDFLSIDKGIQMSLRMLFRNHADAILKLKKCFIMSPSTASVLFRGEAYEKFDVVIVDEASQMEPVDILPVLFRSKQVVLVGDEFQMPPLTHFKTKNRQRISNPDEVLTVDSDISALSLALANLAFNTTELVCHYRSKTETLIEFSQRQFYQFMRTFPATVPATPDLGFTDVYTPDGRCEDGVNTVEAKQAVEQLKAHFDTHFNAQTGVLDSSVGVVAFGESQLKTIISLVNSDKELHGKMDEAFRNFDDVPDKLIFFRTIESVQGQETDHLILSLTYGKNAAGKIVKSFGELNRDATGKNIFNVAVTRARNKITVIHSVSSVDIMGNPRIAFIQDYLACVERYAKCGRDQFMSVAPEKGGSFVDNVAAYLKSIGIVEERIVINYGVTEGSVRIPIAVLTKELDRAELGILCEYPVMKKYNYFDYNVRYVSSLIGRGWKFHRVLEHDWFDNAEVEKRALARAVAEYVTK